MAVLYAKHLRAALATNAGASLAERMRRAEICIVEVRDALCRTESLHWVERALSKYDQAAQPAEDVR